MSERKKDENDLLRMRMLDCTTKKWNLEEELALVNQEFRKAALAWLINMMAK